MLIRNGRSAYQTRVRYNGLVSNEVGNSLNGNGRNRFAGGFSGIFGAYPSGTLAPSAYIMPTKAGSMSSFTLSKSSLTSNSNLIPAINMQASGIAVLTVTNSQLDQIVSLVASGSATLTKVNALLAGSASLQASGSAVLTTNGEIGAIISISASGQAVLSTSGFLTAKAHMQAEGGGPSPLSPEGLAKAVWSENLSTYPVGTAGEDLKNIKSKTKLIPGLF